MADKIDQLKFGNTSYDIDLPPDATPSIASLTAGTITAQSGTKFISIDEDSIQFVDSQIVGYVAIHRNNIVINSGALGSTTLTYPTGTDGTLATQEWVTSQGYTSNTGTVIGSGLTANYFVVGNGTVNVKISSMQPTTSSTTWSTSSDVYVPTMKAISSYVTGLGYTTDSVSGVNDGTNWTSITINGTTKTIPSGGGGAVYKHTVIFDVGYGYYAQLVYYSSSGTAIATATSGTFANSILPYSVAVVTNASGTDYRYVIFKGIQGSGKGRNIPYMFCFNGSNYMEYYPSQLSIGNPGRVTIISDTVTTP